MSINKKVWKCLLFIADIAVVYIAYLLVSYFLLEGLFYKGGYVAFDYTVFVAIALYTIALFIVGGYSNLWRYAGLREYVLCCIACASALVAVTCISKLLPNMIYSIRVHVLSFAFAVIGCVSLRVMPRIYCWLVRTAEMDRKGLSKNERINLLVIGAGEAAKKIINDIYITDSKYNIVGIIDDNKSKIGNKVFRTKVIGTRDDIERVCRENHVNEIMLAIPSLSPSDKKAILNICNKTLCKVRTLPSLSEIISFDNLRGSVRDIQIEDLLERDPIKLDTTKISDYIRDKVILVTGGGGSIGSELCRQIARFEPKILYILDMYENNVYDLENELKRNTPDLKFKVIIASVRDMDRMESIFEDIRPEVVFHAAAHKHVPLMESNPSEAVKNNVLGTLKVVLCAHKFGAKRFVLISTDKAVNPTNIMGATKRIAEMIVQSINRISKTEFVAVRFGNVLGSNGSVVPLFTKQIREGGPLTLTHKEITRFFMTIPEAAQLVLEAASLANGGEIFVLDMGKPVKIYDLAVNLIRLSGYEPDVDIKIETIGLRDGEKLYEELLLEEEGLRETFNKKIFVAAPMSFEWNKLNLELEKLCKAAESFDTYQIRKIIKEIVPTYNCRDYNAQTVTAQHECAQCEEKKETVRCTADAMA